MTKNYKLGSKAKSVEIREFILEKVNHYPSNIANVIQSTFGITRQGANYHLQKLVKNGELVVSGKSRNTQYYEAPVATWEKCFDIADGLEEDKIWYEQVRPLLPAMKENVDFVLLYGFTEMFNNAIDHSEGSQICVTAEQYHANARITISDDGIGIFKKIQREENLEDERHAIIMLSKGKYTTAPEKHSGEGIFFTSKAFDFFDIYSGGICFIHERDGSNDRLIDQLSTNSGTSVVMELKYTSKMNMTQLFDKFASPGGDYQFNETIVPVRKLKASGEFVVSRSQAKRLMSGLEKFQTVKLDFRGVDSIGQAFADEVFRVWSVSHTHVSVIATNTNRSIQNMINRITSVAD